MILIINNIQCDVITGGKDNLLKFNIVKELRKYLRVKAEGYAHTKAYKEKRWDGFQYFCTTKGSFATGFLPLVIPFLSDLGVQIRVQDERKNMPKFVDDFNFDLIEWEARDYQQDAIKLADNYLDIQGNKIYFPRGIYKAATNAGKNSIMAGIHQNVIGAKTLLVVHSTLIYKQATKFFSDKYSVGNIDSKNYDIQDFTIAMYKSLYNKATKSINVKNDLRKFNLLFIDESHKAGADDYAKLITMVPAPMRFFVSGTPLDAAKKSSNLLVVGLSGTVIYNLENKFLIDNKYSARPIIKMQLNNDPKNQVILNYADANKFRIKFNKYRAKLIAEYCEDYPEKQILISVDHKDHGEYLLEQLTLHGVYAVFTHSMDKLKDDKIESYVAGELKILIATMILKEGVNIPNIQTLILAHGGKSIITVKQLIGRVIRNDGIHETVDVLDFYDVGKWLAKHSRDRIRIYKKEGFEIQYAYEADGRGFPKKLK